MSIAVRPFKSRSGTLVLLSLGLLTGCQTGSPAPDLSLNTKQSPQQIVTALAKNAQKCWFKSRDASFREYRLAAEVNSYAGRPRFLIVPRNNPSGLPSLVVQAEKRGDQSSGSFTNVKTFGPLLGTNAGSRITGDIERWSNGSTSCTA